VALKFLDFDPRMPTSASPQLRREGWHFPDKGYFSTTPTTKEKARMGSHPGGKEEK
jgi:hypothetical protein